MMEIVKTFSDIIKAFPARIPGSGTFQPAVSSDDGHVYASTSYLASGDLLLGLNSGSYHDQWIRFPNVTIPAGATIKTAILRFRCLSTRSTALYQKIHFNDADNAVAPVNHADYDNKILTDAYVNWTIESTTSGSNVDSPDVTVPLQEVIDRAGWTSGNALMVLLIDNSSLDWRSMRAYDGDPATSCKLIVTYEYTP